MRFKQFEIRKPTFLGDGPGEEYFKYNFDVVKWADDNSHCWSIGHLEYDKKEGGFEFSSCGLRYLQDRDDGLEEWLVKWCELKELEYSLRYLQDRDNGLEEWLVKGCELKELEYKYEEEK